MCGEIDEPCPACGKYDTLIYQDNDDAFLCVEGRGGCGQRFLDKDTPVSEKEAVEHGERVWKEIEAENRKIISLSNSLLFKESIKYAGDKEL